MIYGTGGKKLGEVKLLNETCPHCKEKDHVFIHGVARYFHIFWIPVFPYKKKIICLCHSCEKEINKKEQPQGLKDKISFEKSNFTIPKYLFIGLVIIIGFIVYFKYENLQHEKFVENRIHHLKSDDIIVFKEDSKAYTFARIVNVVGDTVYFNNGNYVIDSKPTKYDYTSGLEEKEDFFDDELYQFSQKQIDSLYNAGKINIFEQD